MWFQCCRTSWPATSRPCCAALRRDPDADRIIRSLKQSNWVIGNKLRGEFPILFEPGGCLHDRAQRLVAAVRAAFEGDGAQASMAPVAPPAGPSHSG
jgi:hypothetical protein